MKILLILCTFLSGSVMAQMSYQPEGGKFKPKKLECRKKMKELCSGKRGQALRSCHEANMPKLSTVCQRILSRGMSACRADAKKFCKGKMKKAKFKCMMENKNKFSDKCQKFIGKKFERALRKKFRAKPGPEMEGVINPVDEG